MAVIIEDDAMKRGMYANSTPHIIISNSLFPSLSPEKTFVICGVQRGGTSMVAGTMRALGVDMGPAGINHEDAAINEMHLDDMSNYIETRNHDAPVWGFKLPHAALNLPIYLRV